MGMEHLCGLFSPWSYCHAADRVFDKNTDLRIQLSLAPFFILET